MKKILSTILILFSVVVNAQTPMKVINNDLSINGDLTYEFIHGIASTDSISFTTGATKNVYYKLNPTGADTLKDHEADGLLFTGDSIKILTAGDYLIMCYLNLSTSVSNDKIRVKLYKNNAPFTTNEIGRWIINSDGSGSASETKSFIWYVEASANDYFSVRVANITGARAVVLRDWKIYIEKKPE